MAGCASSKNKVTEKPMHNIKASEMPVKGSVLNESSVGLQIEITGLVEIQEDSFFLTQKPNSRSCVTFVLDVDKNLIAKMEELNNQYATLKVEITDASKTWTKSAKVLEIVK